MVNWNHVRWLALVFCSGYHGTMEKRIVIVGAGIIGVSLALQLARKGAEVFVVDELAKPAGAATPRSWAWINASWGNDPDYFRLRNFSMERWHELQKIVPALSVNWCGGLLWDLPRSELENFAKERQNQGYAIRLLEPAGIAEREPSLMQIPDIAVLAEGEGSVEPLHAVEKLAAAAKLAGAQFTSATQVAGLQTQGARVTGVKTNGGLIVADHVIIAAGTGSVRLLKDVGLALALEQPEGLLVTSTPVPHMLNGLVMAPELHVRQTSEGRLVAGSDFGGADPGGNPEKTARDLFAKVQALLRGGGYLKMEGFTVGVRPALPDGVPCVGAVPGYDGLSIAVTHSGITLAPAIAEFLTDEIVEGRVHPLMMPYRPDRVIGPAP